MRIGLALVMGVVLAAGVGIGAGVGPAQAAPRVITVTGQGQVSRAPDMATINVGVSHQDVRADVAMQMVTGALNTMISALENSEIAPQDMQTQGLSLQAMRDHKSTQSGGPRLVGFLASSQLSLRVRVLDDLGDVLTALVAAGANDMRGIGFDLSNPQTAQDAARRAAIADARARAELYARAAGVSLGQVLSISEGAGAAPQPEMMRSAMAGAVPIAAGEVTLRAQVQVTWELQD